MTDKIDISAEAVKRHTSYDIMMSLDGCALIPSHDGTWVSYSDYEALSARLDDVEADVGKLRGAFSCAGMWQARAEAAEAKLARAVEFISRMAGQKIEHACEDADWQGGYEAAVMDARATLAEIGEGHE